MDQTKVCVGCDSQKMKADFVATNGQPNPKGKYCSACYDKKQNTYEFKIEGSKGQHTTTFTKLPNGVSSSCDCKTSRNGVACKHRLRILRGDARGVVSDNRSEVSIVKTWLSGTEVESLMKHLGAREVAAERIEKDIKKAKKQLAKLLGD